MARIEFTPGWEEELGRQVRRQFQEAFDVVFRRYSGHPVERVKEVLRREFKRRGATITDPELTQYAEAISQGTRIRVRAA